MLQLVTGMDNNDKNLGNMGGTCNRFGDVNFSQPIPSFTLSAETQEVVYLLWREFL